MADQPMQDTFDDMLEAEERRIWAQRRTCRHCFVTIVDEINSTVAVVCAHRCGTVKDLRPSQNMDADRAKAARTQEAFKLAHVRGCPRQTSAR